MNFHRGLWAGAFLLLMLPGCSQDNKTLNVEGAYAPVIADVGTDHQPVWRGAANRLTALVQNNVRGYPLKFHWSAAGVGQFADTALTGTPDLVASCTWTPPDSIGVYPVTVSVEAYDELNKTSFFTTRTIRMFVDNAYVRWTKNERIQLDIAPPVQGKIYYSEIRNSTTGESDVWSVASPLGTPQQITSQFFTATSPTVQSDGSRLVFLGRRRNSDVAPSIWGVSPSGGDTTSAILNVKFNVSTNGNLGSPRFGPSGSLFLYCTDSTSFSAPRPWIRDAGNLSVAPFRLIPASANPAGEQGNTYWNGNWNGAGDSVVLESYVFFKSTAQESRGLFRLSALPLSNTVAPYTAWLLDYQATDPDWSPDGQYMVFTRKSPSASDRDIWIIPANSSDVTTAIQVTQGPADDSHPRFSSDGNSIFFISNRTDSYGSNGVYETERRGTNVWSVSEFDRP